MHSAAAGQGIETIADENGYVKRQIDARKRQAVVKIRFLTFRSKFPNGVVFAVEGDDDKVVYSHWIARATPQLAYEFFVCEGKRGLRQLRNLLHADRSGTENETLFIVDRDFDDLSGFDTENRVFMLDRYSIENYLVDADVLDASIRSAYPGSSDPHIRARVCALFCQDYQAFLRAATPLNERIFVGRKLSLDIDDYIPSSIGKIASVALGQVEDLGCSPIEIIPFVADVESHELPEIHAEFATLEPSKRYRGKFAMKFLRSWLDCLAAEYRNPKLGIFGVEEHASGKIKHDELSAGSLAMRSDLPVNFAEFLDRHC